MVGFKEADIERGKMDGKSNGNSTYIYYLYNINAI